MASNTTMKLAALLILAMAAAAIVTEASSYSTTVTTFEAVDESSSSQQRCQREMSQHRLDACRRFMQSGKSTDRMAPRECCDQLRDVDRKMMRKVRGEEMMMKMKGQFLPAMCDLEPKMCDISQTGVY